jgi:hypothetical protein
MISCVLPSVAFTWRREDRRIVAFGDIMARLFGAKYGSFFEKMRLI